MKARGDAHSIAWQPAPNASDVGTDCERDEKALRASRTWRHEPYTTKQGAQQRFQVLEEVAIGEIIGPKGATRWRDTTRAGAQILGWEDWMRLFDLRQAQLDPRPRALAETQNFSGKLVTSPRPPRRVPRCAASSSPLPGRELGCRRRFHRVDGFLGIDNAPTTPAAPRSWPDWGNPAAMASGRVMRQATMPFVAPVPPWAGI
jgi:hypothetical protein